MYSVSKSAAASTLSIIEVALLFMAELILELQFLIALMTWMKMSLSFLVVAASQHSKIFHTHISRHHYVKVADMSP